MLDLLRCPRGHERDDSFEEGLPADGELLLCPVCGVEVSAARTEPLAAPSPFDLKGATIRVDKLSPPINSTPKPFRA